MPIDPQPDFNNTTDNDPGNGEDELAAIYYALAAIHQDIENNLSLEYCEAERRNQVDIASGLLALAFYFIYDRYYDKYQDIIEWRDDIGNRIKSCLERDIDHFINFVMQHMDDAMTDIINADTVSVEYQEILERYCGYSDNVANSAKNLITLMDHKNCPGCPECQQCADDIAGWSTMAAISAADKRVRFDERRVPARLDLHSASLDSAHSSTFNLPQYDYQALSVSANLSGSLATAYAGIANSALGSFGYFSTNFVNSL